MQPSRDGRRLAARRAGRPRAGDVRTITELYDAASDCDLCRLCHERTMVVTGAGPIDADVVIVTEAPTYHEDRSGELLVGRPGALLDDLLGIAGLRRDEVYVTSVVKCRPPSSRAPFPDEVEACEGWLFREIALVQPQVVVTLGALALRLITGREQRIVDARGQMQHAQIQGRDVVVWPMLHPAAAMHVPRLIDVVRSDARTLGVLVSGARSDRSSSRASAAVVVAADTGGEPQLAMDIE